MLSRLHAKVCWLGALTILAVSSGAAHATLILVSFDDFADGGFTFNSTNGSPAGADVTASVPGGKRSISFVNFGSTGSVTLDPSTRTLAFTSSDLGHISIGYGFKVVLPGVMQNDSGHQLNADWTGYRGIRIHVLENSVRMKVSISLSTHNASSSNSNFEIELEDGQTGDLDILFSDFSPTNGGVDWTDVDYVNFTIYNRYVDSDWTIGGIELLAGPEPGALMLLLPAASVLALRRNRSRSPRSTQT